MTHSDSALIERVLAGETDCFRPLVQRYQDAVYGAALSKTGSFSDAEDIAQDTFLAAFESLQGLHDPERFGAWLYGIALNRVKMQLRQDQRRRKRHGSLCPPVHESSAPDELATRNETRAEVIAALERLPDAGRETATLYYINGYSTADISRFTNHPLGTIKRRLHDARRQLRKELIGMVEDELKKSRPTREFTDRVLRKISHVRVWFSDERDQNNLLLTDSEGRCYVTFMGEYEADAAEGCVSGSDRPEAADIHTAAAELLRCFNRQVLRLSLSLSESSVPNLTVRADVQVQPGEVETVEVDYSGRDAWQFAVQSGADLFIDKDVADGHLMRRRDGKPMTLRGALQSLKRRMARRFSDTAAVIAELERRPKSRLARRAMIEGTGTYKTDAPLVRDTTGGMEAVMDWLQRQQGKEMEWLAAGIIGALHLHPIREPAKGVPYLERAHLLRPGDRDIAFDLATAYDLTGQKDQELALLEEFRFNGAAACCNFANVWQEPRFRELFGEPDALHKDCFRIRQLDQIIVGANRPGVQPVSKGGVGQARTTARISQSRARSLGRLLDEDTLVVVRLLYLFRGRGGMEYLLLEAAEGCSAVGPLPRWPDRRLLTLGSAVEGQPTPWRTCAQATLDLLNGVGVAMEAAVLLRQEGANLVAAVVGSLDGRRACALLNGLDAVSLALAANRPLLMAEDLAEQLYVRGKNGGPLTMRGAKRKLGAE